MSGKCSMSSCRRQRGEQRFCIERLEHRRVLASLVDLDGDGDLDVLHRHTWYENHDGYGNFTAHSIAAAPVIYSVAADLDSDGDLDIVTNEPRWYENDGSGAFPVVHSFPGAELSLIQFTLFDAGLDGDVDIVAWRWNSAYFFENTDGKGTFRLATWKVFESWVSLGDFDLDGRLDYLDVEHRDYRSELAEDPTPRDVHMSVIWLYRDVGNGQFEPTFLAADTIPASAFPDAGPGSDEWDDFLDSFRSTVVTWWANYADIDGNGALDVIRWNRHIEGHIDSVQWYANVDGTIDGPPMPLLGPWEAAIFFEDIDGDGDREPIYSAYGDYVGWSINDSGNFSRGGLLRIGAAWFDAFDVGDINGDGLIDALLVESSEEMPYWFDGYTRDRHVDGQVPPPARRSVNVFLEQPYRSDSGTLLRSADFDGDGRHEIVARNYQGASDLVWLRPRPNDLTLELSGTLPDTSTLDSNHLLPIDFDSDGDIDLLSTTDLLAPIAEYSVILLENVDGKGTFERRPIGLDVNAFNARQLIAADLNNDGRIDLVAVDNAPGQYNVKVHLGQSEGGFETQIIDDRFIPSIIVADVDFDGDLDLVTDRLRVPVWYENRQGNFAAPSSLIPENESVRFVGDLDADDQPDLVAATSESIHTYERLDGEFVLQQVIPYPDPDTIQMVDVDTDGDLDMFVSSPRGIEWFANDKGRFDGPYIDVLTQAGFDYLEYADWDGDGDTDVIRRTGWDWSVDINRQVGDVNDDRRFDSADLVALIAAGHYEDGIDGNSAFAEGDWNGDGDFTSADLILALALGHFQTI